MNTIIATVYLNYIHDRIRKATEEPDSTRSSGKKQRRVVLSVRTQKERQDTCVL